MLVSFPFLFSPAQRGTRKSSISGSSLRKIPTGKKLSVSLFWVPPTFGSDFLGTQSFWIQVGEKIAFSKNAIPHKRPRTPNFFLSPLLILTVEVSFVLMLPRKPFMEINEQYLKHLSSAFGVGHHLRTREKNAWYLLHYMKSKQVIYQILQIKGSVGVKQPWVQAKKCRRG